MKQKFSVLMSIYSKEIPKNFKECMESILSQTVLPDEIVIVEDGLLTKELYDSIEEYVEKSSIFIKRVKLEKNLGLGLALARGITECNYDLIARMDTDDICVNNRFEKQIKEFEKDSELDICGSHIDEFIDTPTNIVDTRKVPLYNKEIKKYQKMRDSFNHMTVMYKKESVLRAGNYENVLLMEDTMLWTRMIMSGIKAKNIDESLVLARVGNDMYKRRGGLSYFNKYKAARKKILSTGFINYFEYFISISIQFVVTLMPERFRAFIFKVFLRK